MLSKALNVLSHVLVTLHHLSYLHISNGKSANTVIWFTKRWAMPPPPPCRVTTIATLNREQILREKWLENGCLSAVTLPVKPGSFQYKLVKRRKNLPEREETPPGTPVCVNFPPHLRACPTVDPGRPPSVGAGGGPSSTNGGGMMDPGVLGMAVQHSPAADHLGVAAWYVLATTKDPWRRSSP